MKSNSIALPVLSLILIAAFPALVKGEENEVANLEAPPSEDSALDGAPIDWLTSGDGSIGGFLFPTFHAFGAFGDSTADPADLAAGDHDPNNAATLQSLEPGLSLRAGMLQGFANAAGTTNAAGDFNFVLEEGFLKLVGLPLGLELRGGQFFNRFGFQNSIHNHGWNYVDQMLPNGRLLNEGELITQGGEVSVNVPLPMMQTSIISAAVGGAPMHSHGDEHEHGEEAEFEADGANFGGTLASVNWLNQYDFNDMNRLTGTLAGVWGENLYGRDTRVYGVGLEYLWRENGYGSGGRLLRWRNEVFYRDIDAISGHLPGEEEEEEEEHEHRDDPGEEEHHDDDERRFANFDEVGAYSALTYGLGDHLELGLRGDWIGGISALGLDERVRISPNITWYANPERNLQARIQYNWDHSDDFGSESSIWFQIGLSWGGAEVR